MTKKDDNEMPATSRPNIPADVLNAALDLGLCYEMTGGGCDYITRPLGRGRTAVLIADEAAGGGCPASLEAAAFLFVFVGPTWEEDEGGRSYATASAALSAMASMEAV